MNLFENGIHIGLMQALYFSPPGALIGQNTFHPSYTIYTVSPLSQLLERLHTTEWVALKMKVETSKQIFTLA